MHDADGIPDKMFLFFHCLLDRGHIIFVRKSFFTLLFHLKSNIVVFGFIIFGNIGTNILFPWLHKHFHHWFNPNK